MVHADQCLLPSFYEGTDWRQAWYTDNSSPGNCRAKIGTAARDSYCLFFHEGKYLIVESNWGKATHADWYLNLKKNPRAVLQINGRTISTEAHDAEGNEYARLWKFVTERHSPYLQYQNRTTRRIPVVVFEPACYLVQ